eukprot:5081399-Pyramimonas_sp.AAC.1
MTYPVRDDAGRKVVSGQRVGPRLLCSAGPAPLRRAEWLAAPGRRVAPERGAALRAFMLPTPPVQFLAR